MPRFGALLLLAVLAPIRLAAADPWVADLGGGRYRNPILFADYSDPDVVRVGEDFYMVASSFNAMPGIPVLHSKDLVNWTLVGHVFESLPFQNFDKPAHGLGAWAPSIRYHDGRFYVYFCAPSTGLFVATAEDPAGPWDLRLMAAVELWEDPAPFWDDDGRAYLVRGKVRADTLYLHRMSEDGMRLLDDGRVIYRNLDEQPVIEGPKLLKKDGRYYILAPAGGVPTGWQAALRAQDIYGPWESKVVLHQGTTAINGPHQGGLVELATGEWWFVHFQDRGVYGRIVHLEPVHWQDGWPMMGEDIDGDGIGEPVSEWQKPDVGRTCPIAIPQTSDEFDAAKLGLQWQWHANPDPDWYSLDAGRLRLFAVRNPTQAGNLHFVPNLLLQKFASPAFSAVTRIDFRPATAGDKSGLVVMGKEWGYLALYRSTDGVHLGAFRGRYEQYDDATELLESVDAEREPGGGYEYLLKVDVEDGGSYRFSYSRDGKQFTTLGPPLAAREGIWIGAKVGLFALNPSLATSDGYANFEWFRVH